MRNLLFCLFLIVSILVLIGSCATDESSSSSTSSDNSSSTTTTSTLSAPSDVTATLGWHQVAVDWTAVSGASSYTVYWGTSTGISSSSTSITGITDDNYTHTSLDNGTTYYYTVAAVDSSGTGSLSSEVSATPRTGPTVTEACTYGEAASGVFSGLIKTHASGTYYHSWQGAEPSDGCIDNSSAISAFSMVAASGTQSVKHAAIIQGDGNAYMESWNFYMLDNCTKQSGFLSFYNDNLTLGDNITYITNSPGPDNATKVWYKNNYICALAETAAQETTLETLFGGNILLTVGTVLDQANGTDNNTVIWTVLDNISSTTLNYLYSE
ncbi:fibronectin type III domain-containing protein, partial [bacterium]|nr:fibronectin type III domain-containing protein [bacterium]